MFSPVDSHAPYKRGRFIPSKKLTYELHSQIVIVVDKQDKGSTYDIHIRIGTHINSND